MQPMLSYELWLIGVGAEPLKQSFIYPIAPHGAMLL
jgi:hypothetical protein